MAGPDEKKADAKMEIWMGNLLRIGVLLATLVVLVGGAPASDSRRDQNHRSTCLSRRAGGSTPPGQDLRRRIYARPEGRHPARPAYPHRHSDCAVLFSLIAFLWRRDITFAVLTLFVLVLLIVSLSTGALG